MLSVAICDDDALFLKKIRAFCNEFFSAQGTDDVVISDFSRSVDFLLALENSWSPDIALLDICMPDISGLTLAQKLHEKNPSSKIIFLSSSREYAVDAFAVNAVHYLVKPFDKPLFEDAMTRAMEKIGEGKKHVVINGESGNLTVVCAPDIDWIESIGYKRYVHIQGEELTETKRTLTQFLVELETLCPERFISPYRGYIVNLASVRTITSKGILMKDGKSIIIKPGDFRMLKEKLFHYIFVLGGGKDLLGVYESSLHRISLAP